MGFIGINQHHKAQHDECKAKLDRFPKQETKSDAFTGVTQYEKSFGQDSCMFSCGNIKYTAKKNNIVMSDFPSIVQESFKCHRNYQSNSFAAEPRAEGNHLLSRPGVILYNIRLFSFAFNVAEWTKHPHHNCQFQASLSLFSQPIVCPPPPPQLLHFLFRHWLK